MLGKAARDHYGMRVTGFLNGFRGLANDQTVELDGAMLSGILTDGGTILGTSRDKPHRMPIGGKMLDMTDAVVATYHRHHLDALVCLGGGGTQKNAQRLVEAGLNVVTLPKTIDNDIALTDRSFGFDTALQIATEAIDRLHSTATSHERIIVVEVMGHRAGWLALEAGIAGGADVILLPEIPYDAGENRRRDPHAARSPASASASWSWPRARCRWRKPPRWTSLIKARDKADSKKERAEISEKLSKFHDEHVGHTIRLTRKLEKLTGQETRLTILGHLQRGGTPSAADRVFATWLGTECAEVLNARQYGVMLALQGNRIARVPIADVAGQQTARPAGSSVDHRRPPCWDLIW